MSADGRGSARKRARDNRRVVLEARGFTALAQAQIALARILCAGNRPDSAHKVLGRALSACRKADEALWRYQEVPSGTAGAPGEGGRST